MTLPGRAANRAFVPPANEAYAYDGAGNLVSTTYSDETPSIACAYDRSGNIVSAVTDGVATNFYAYCEEGLVTNEVQNGATLARSYDSLGRPTGYTLRASATPREVSFSYDLLGRLAIVSSGTNLFTYSYLLGTDLVSGYTCGGFSRTVAYEPYRDLVSAITNRFGSRVISTFEYANDAAGRRTAIKRGGEAMGPLSGATDAYGYNGRNEVVSARRTLGGSPVAGFDEDFAYDPIGNRILSTDYDETGAARTSTYTANNLNQYTARTVPGWASVRGLADADATVAVNGNLAYALASGDLAYFFGSDDFDNSNGGGFAELEVSAVVSDGTNDLVSVATNRVFVPSANETYAYDADGNQTLVTTGTGAWQVEYNGENRPVKWTCVSPDSSTPNSSTPTLVLMTFDHQGRRRLYVEVAAGVTNKLHRFTYDDYVCIARSREVDAQHGVGSDAFVWDPTEPIATRPLMCAPSTETPFFYCHDGNKNVSETVSLYGTIAAHYDYSSFGKVVLVTSESEDQSTANLNPYRFSSEYADDALGLVYYNFRHYNPCDGRWIGRDLMESSTVADSFVYCANNLCNRYDWLGNLGRTYGKNSYKMQRYKVISESVRCPFEHCGVCCEPCHWVQDSEQEVDLPLVVISEVYTGGLTPYEIAHGIAGEVAKYFGDKAKGLIEDYVLKKFNVESFDIPFADEILAISNSEYLGYLPGSRERREIDGYIFTGYQRQVSETWHYNAGHLIVPSCRNANKSDMYYQPIGSAEWVDKPYWR